MRETKESGVECIGKIPASWTTPKIKNIATFHNGDRSSEYPSGDDIVDEGIMFITSDNIHSLQLDTKREKNKYITEDKYNRLRGAKIQINDIVFCLRGSLGACSINKELSKGTVASSLVVIRPNGLINPDYLNYYLHSPMTTMQTDNYMNGSCAANLSAENVGNYLFIEPPLAEQVSIVNYLDNQMVNIDDAITRHKQIIEKLEEYKRSVITHAVTKGLNPDAEMKDSGVEWVGEIPAVWLQTPLHLMFTERKNKNKDCNENNLLSLSYGRVKRKDINTNEGLLPESFSGYNIVEPGDIVLRLTDLQNDHRSLRTGLVTEHGIITSAYVTLQPIKKIDSRYYRYLLHSYDIMKVFYSMGEGIRQSAGFADFAPMRLPTPPYDEQAAIADYLDKTICGIDEAITRQQAAIEKLEEYRQSIIYNAVTGKIDCRSTIDKG